MSKRKDSELLSDILEAARRLMAYTDNMTYEVFISDRGVLKFGVI